MDDYRSMIKDVVKTASTEEFPAPSIDAYRGKYEALKELYLELWEKIRGESPSRFFYDVKRDLRVMGTNLVEARNGAPIKYSRFSDERIDRNLRYLAFVERLVTGLEF